MFRAVLKIVGYAVDLDAGLAEVQQQAEVQVGRLQIVEALRGVRIVQGFSSICRIIGTSGMNLNRD